MPYKVFISYSTKDLMKVNNIREQLKREGVEVFVAEYSIKPGEELNKKIIEEIKNCDLLVYLCTKNSMKSKYANQEIGIAKGNNKDIIPIITQKGLKPPALINNLKYLNIDNSIDEINDYISLQIEGKRQKRTNNLILIGTIMLIIYLLKK
jgi:5S rRNA maturation endonuclease (ribonuclease M5)